MFDLGKLIGGPDEGDGIIGAFLGIFALGGAAAAAGGDGFFDGVGGASMADGFGASVGGFGDAAVSEGLGRGFFAHMFENATVTDYYVLWDAISGRLNRTMRHTFEALGANTREVLSAHGFMRQQLNEQGFTALSQEYAALGTNLPDDKLLKRAYMALLSKLHPDHNPNGGELTKTLNAARDTLNDFGKVCEYTTDSMIHNSVFKEFLDEFGKARPDWNKATEDAARAERVAKGHLLEDGAAGTRRAESGFKQWMGGLSTGQKTGLAFAGVATVGLGVVLGMKIAEHRRKKKSQTAFGQTGPIPLVDSASFVDRIHSPEPQPVHHR